MNPVNPLDTLGRRAMHVMRRTEAALSPWVRRALQRQLNAVTRANWGMSLNALPLRRLRRRLAHHMGEDASVAGDLGRLTPELVERFTDRVVNRLPMRKLAAKYAPVASDAPEKSEETLASAASATAHMPLANGMAGDTGNSAAQLQRTANDSVAGDSPMQSAADVIARMKSQLPNLGAAVAASDPAAPESNKPSRLQRIQSARQTAELGNTAAATGGLHKTQPPTPAVRPSMGAVRRFSRVEEVSTSTQASPPVSDGAQPRSRAARSNAPTPAPSESDTDDESRPTGSRTKSVAAPTVSRHTAPTLPVAQPDEPVQSGAPIEPPELLQPEVARWSASEPTPSVTPHSVAPVSEGASRPSDAHAPIQNDATHTAIAPPADASAGLPVRRMAAPETGDEQSDLDLPSAEIPQAQPLPETRTAVEMPLLRRSIMPAIMSDTAVDDFSAHTQALASGDVPAVERQPVGPNSPIATVAPDTQIGPVQRLATSSAAPIQHAPASDVRVGATQPSAGQRLATQPEAALSIPPPTTDAPDGDVNRVTAPHQVAPSLQPTANRASVASDVDIARLAEVEMSVDDAVGRSRQMEVAPVDMPVVRKAPVALDQAAVQRAAEFNAEGTPASETSTRQADDGMHPAVAQTDVAVAPTPDAPGMAQHSAPADAAALATAHLATGAEILPTPATVEAVPMPATTTPVAMPLVQRSPSIALQDLAVDAEAPTEITQADAARKTAQRDVAAPIDHPAAPISAPAPAPVSAPTTAMAQAGSTATPLTPSLPISVAGMTTHVGDAKEDAQAEPIAQRVRQTPAVSQSEGAVTSKAAPLLAGDVVVDHADAVAKDVGQTIEPLALPLVNRRANREVTTALPDNDEATLSVAVTAAERVDTISLPAVSSDQSAVQRAPGAPQTLLPTGQPIQVDVHSAQAIAQAELAPPLVDAASLAATTSAQAVDLSGMTRMAERVQRLPLSSRSRRTMRLTRVNMQTYDTAPTHDDFGADRFDPTESASASAIRRTMRRTTQADEHMRRADQAINTQRDQGVRAKRQEHSATQINVADAGSDTPTRTLASVQRNVAGLPITRIASLSRGQTLARMTDLAVRRLAESDQVIEDASAFDERELDAVDRPDLARPMRQTKTGPSALGAPVAGTNLESANARVAHRQSEAGSAGEGTDAPRSAARRTTSKSGEHMLPMDTAATMYWPKLAQRNTHPTASEPWGSDVSDWSSAKPNFDGNLDGVTDGMNVSGYTTSNVSTQLPMPLAARKWAGAPVAASEQSAGSSAPMLNAEVLMRAALGGNPEQSTPSTSTAVNQQLQSNGQRSTLAMPLPVAPKSNLMQRAIDTHGEPTDDRSLGNTSDDDTDSVITPHMPDLDDLARRVYPLLKRLIAMERERVRSF